MRWSALLGAAALLACGGGERPVPVEDASVQRRALELENQRAVRLEERDMNAYVERAGLHPRTSGTGVRWLLVRDLPGDTVRPEQLVSVNYAMLLIGGDTAYASVAGKPESFRVEHDDVESGLHEAIQHLSRGDSAIIIIPSYRAFGLIGDMEKVPPRSTVIYHLGLQDVRDR